MAAQKVRENQVSIATKERIRDAVVHILKETFSEEEQLQKFADTLADLDGKGRTLPIMFLRAIDTYRNYIEPLMELHEEFGIKEVIQPFTLNQILTGRSGKGFGPKRKALLTEVFDYLRENVNFEAIDNSDILKDGLRTPEAQTGNVTTETQMFTTPRWRAEAAKAELEEQGIDLSKTPALREMFREV